MIRSAAHPLVQVPTVFSSALFIPHVFLAHLGHSELNLSAQHSSLTGTTYSLNDFTAEANLEHLVNVRGQWSSPGRHVLQLASQQIPDLPVSSDPRHRCAMYLFEHQGVVKSVLDLSGRSPISKFGVNGLGQEGTLDASGVHLRFDGSVDPECQPLQARASLV